MVHQSCNLQYSSSKIVPVVFHNLKYDLHFLIRELASSTKLPGTVGLIPQNKEQYISFTKNIKGSDVKYRFIDSFRFMPSSLEKLASYLEEKPIVVEQFQKDGYSSEQIELLLRKGVYPYDYTDGYEKLEETELPTHEQFYNQLNDTNISEQEYKHAQTVWNTFNANSLRSYSDLYLKTDCLLLAQVFENFRQTSLEAYGLDPAHYHTTPGFSFDCMLKMTNVSLELLSDIDMVLFIEQEIRGGLSQVRVINDSLYYKNDLLLFLYFTGMFQSIRSEQ